MLNFNENFHKKSKQKETKKTNNQDEKYIVEGKIEVSAENIFLLLKPLKPL